MVLCHVVEILVGNTLHQKPVMHGYIVHVPIVQPLLSREYSAWEQVGALEALQHGLEQDQSHCHLWKKGKKHC